MSQAAAAWAGVGVALLAIALTVLGAFIRVATRSGRVDAVLERMADVLEDHEDRLRGVERGERGERERGRGRGIPDWERRGRG